MTAEQILEEAEMLIDFLAEKSLTDAHIRLEKEKHGKGCGCLRCKHSACTEMNDIADFISEGHDPVFWFVNSKGEITFEIDYKKMKK